MPRPKVPLISRRSVIRVGLDLVEQEGMDALTVRRIAKELDVNAASLYHYFASKEEILTSVTRAALAEMPVPAMKEGEDWRHWFAEVGIEYRAFLIARPYLTQLRVNGYVSRADLPTEAAAMARMTEAGVPPEHQMVILDTIEAFVIGSALMHEGKRGTSLSGGAAQRKRRAALEDEVFAGMLRTVVVELTERFAPAAED
ncbi:TetR/AcrR family transcriptional regulator [Amycolatopsis acidicola]|nr:TetR/AcrR family transcriptional regulator [Amycolatopsis acidicola]